VADDPMAKLAACSQVKAIEVIAAELFHKAAFKSVRDAVALFSATASIETDFALDEA
jgi:hypothetical protein